jgi:hypothetical protein
MMLGNRSTQMASRFEFSVSLVLAAGLGGLSAHTLLGGDADGYPSGAAISTGSNPVFSTGGSFEFDPGAGATTPSIAAAPADQDLIITDVSFSVSSGHSSCSLQAQIDLLVDGEGLAAYSPMSGMARSNYYAFNATPAVQSFTSGVRVPAGSSLDIRTGLLTWAGDYCDDSRSQYLVYTLSGYYAQP